MTQRGRLMERHGRVHAFGPQDEPVGTFKTRIAAKSALSLAQQADAILKRARCDPETGAKQDRKYRRNKRAERKRFARLARARSKKLGKFGAASSVRNISPDGCWNERSRR
jgi:hypothetical protein